MRTMTAEEYDRFGPRPEVRPCPNPACYDGRDTGRDIGLSAALFGRDALWPPVRPVCPVCGGLGQVEVIP